MVRGFYQLGSGMLAKNMELSNISNNITNVKTNGFKRKTVVTSSFQSMLIHRVENGKTPIGSSGMTMAVAETDAIHTQGMLESTNRALDFAIRGEGFFAVQGQNGVQYTRKGEFQVDDQGYLTVSGGGRVLGMDGAPIRTGTDQITSDDQGHIFVNGTQVGQLAVYDFDDYNTLTETMSGFYNAGGNARMVNPDLLWQSLEGSNVDMSQEMTSAIATQRELQSCSQVLKMYDQVLAKATSELGKV